MNTNTITPQIRQNAAAIAIETLRVLGREDLLPMLWIDWRTRFTSRMGDAMYTKSHRVQRNLEQFRNDNGFICCVRFSVPLWLRASEEERRETVIHEICHLVTSHEARLAGVTVEKSHGPEWKAVMRRAGVTPKRCHNVNNNGLSKRKTIQTTCNCEHGHSVTPLVAGRILNGVKYTCGACKARLVLGDLTSAQVKACKEAVAKDIMKPRRSRRARRGSLAAALGL